MKKGKFMRFFAGTMAAAVVTVSALPISTVRADDINTDYTAVTEAAEEHGNGFEEISSKWFSASGGWNNYYAPNAIDPTTFFDAEDNLYMVYGSWSGGLFILPLDKETGEVLYPGQDGTDAESGNAVDRYFGTHIAGGNYQSGEGPYIIYDEEAGYYYLYVTYGELSATGGYNMRLFRSENVYGPYLDAAGNNAADSGARTTENYNTKFGIKLIGNYRFLNQPEFRAAGHNSVLIDRDGARYLIYHQRFGDKGHLSHEVRVHQQFLNEDLWPVTAVYEYRGEKIGHYENSQVVGSYQLINHGTNTSGDLPETQSVQLNGDGTITGDVTGTWEKKTGKSYDYATLQISGVTYKGVFLEQQDESADELDVMTFTAIGDNNESLWGSSLEMNDKTYAQLAAAALDEVMVSDTNEDLELPDEIKGASILWESEDASVMDRNGRINRGNEDKQVTLRAQLHYGDAVITREYTITVSAYADLVYHYDFESVKVDKVLAASDSVKTDAAELMGTAGIDSDAEHGNVLKLQSDSGTKNQNYLRLPEDALSFVGKKGFTVSFWAKIGQGSNVNSALFNAMLNGTYPMTRIGVNLITRINANSTYLDAPDANSGAGSQMKDAKWHHIAYSMSPTGCNIWVDGRVYASVRKDISGCFSNSGIKRAADVRIGSGSPWGDEDIQDALFDDIAIYDGAMSTAEVEKLYQGIGNRQLSRDTVGQRVNAELLEKKASVSETRENGANGARIMVHDPAIIRGEDGTYYVYGSHLASAKSDNLIQWEQITGDYNTFNWKTDSIYGDILTNLADSFAWTGYDGGSSINVWAPNIMWNPYYINADGTKGAYMDYYCMSTYGSSCSCIGYAVSRRLDGGYQYADTVIYTGFTKTGETDGSGSRDTKWDNDYLNLTRLINHYHNIYTVTYDSNAAALENGEAAVSGAMEKRTEEKGSTVTVEAVGYSAEDYVFTGWNTRADGTGVSYQEKDVLEITEDITLYAQWEKKSVPQASDTSVLPGNSSSDSVKTPKAAPQGTQLKSADGASYRVTRSEGTTGEVEYKAPASKKLKTAKIPDTVTIDGITYKVTGIADNAFKNQKKLTSVTIGARVAQIGKNAFYGCGKLKKITIQSALLKKVGAKAFKGVKKNVTVKVPKKQLKKYKKLLKNKGLSTSARIK